MPSKQNKTKQNKKNPIDSYSLNGCTVWYVMMQLDKVITQKKTERTEVSLQAGRSS
jgi:hypothetical protein